MTILGCAPGKPRTDSGNPGCGRWTAPGYAVAGGGMGQRVWMECKKYPASWTGGVSVCALDRIRTYGLLLRRQTLYPLSYEGIRGSLRCRWDVLELSSH